MKRAMQRRGLLATLFLLLWQVSALADLQVFPTRLVLTDKRRIMNISLRHLGKKTATYRISAIFYRMTPDGQLVLIDKPTEDERSLVKLLRFSPRTVQLEPNVEQVVKVMFAGPQNLPEGEYRAHLHFEPSDSNDDVVPIGEKKSADGKISMQLSAKVAVAVPVIFRHGNPTYSATLSTPQVVTLPDKSAGFSVDIQSTGNAFPYGDFQVFFTPKGQTAEQVGEVRGIAAYLGKRTVTYALTLPKDMKLTNGTLRVEFHEPEENSAKLIASSEAAIP